MIILREIDIDNFWECIDLKVAENQREFVTTNAVSIAQSKVQPECIPLAIYQDERMVGFLMYCIDRDDGEYWIYRMMIDEKDQSKGYAQQAMELLLARIQSDSTHRRILLGVHLESKAAVRLYESFGFRFTGQIFGQEHIMELKY